MPTDLPKSSMLVAKTNCSAVTDIVSITNHYFDLFGCRSAGQLSDNGSGYIARETRALAHDIGLIACRTPYRSPRSNGVAEAFVKTFKRDYVSVNPVPDGPTVLEQLAKWFDNYNTVHPHSDWVTVHRKSSKREKTEKIEIDDLSVFARSTTGLHHAS